MRKFEAEEELAKIVAPLNATQSSRRDDRVTLEWFVEHHWRPTVEGNWGPTTKKTNKYFVRAILAAFGDKSLRDLDLVELQNWLNRLSADYSRSMVFHCYTYLKAICAEAVRAGFPDQRPGPQVETAEDSETR